MNGKNTTGRQEAARTADWNAAHYDAHIGYVSRLGRGLIELLRPAEGERILDVGCGTGALASDISRHGAVCVGMDASEAMVRRARELYPELTFFQAEAQTFRLKAGERPYDAIFSNAALHWIKPPEQAAESIALALRQGGRLVAEFGGSGNVERIREAIREVVAEEQGSAPDEPWYFPGIAEYSSLLAGYGLETTYAELYDRPTPLDDGDNGLRHWLDAFAGKLFAGWDDTRRAAAYGRIEERLRPQLYDGNKWVADYRRLRIAAIKHR